MVIYYAEITMKLNYTILFQLYEVKYNSSISKYSG